LQELLFQLFEVAERVVALDILQHLLLFLSVKLEQVIRILGQRLDVEFVAGLLDVDLVAENGVVFVVLLPLCGVEFDYGPEEALKAVLLLNEEAQFEALGHELVVLLGQFLFILFPFLVPVLRFLLLGDYAFEQEVFAVECGLLVLLVDGENLVVDGRQAGEVGVLGHALDAHLLGCGDPAALQAEEVFGVHVVRVG